MSIITGSLKFIDMISSLYDFKFVLGCLRKIKEVKTATLRVNLLYIIINNK